MSQIIQDIAAAVKDRINGGSYSYVETVTATRKYLPTYDKESLSTLQVSVVPKTWETEVLDRGEDWEGIGIDVGIQRSVDADADAAIDALMKLVGEIRARLNRFNPATTPKAHWMRTANVPIYDQTTLRERRVFISVITVIFNTNQ